MDGASRREGDTEGKGHGLGRKDVEEKVRGDRQKAWRLSVEGRRAVMDTVVVGVGYLL